MLTKKYCPWILLAFFGLFFCSNGAFGQGAISGYEARILSTEPHPYTADPGRLIIEFSPLHFTYDRYNLDRSRDRLRAFSMPMLFKAGVTDAVELNLGFDAFYWEEFRSEESWTDRSSFAFREFALGAKINLWGNDDGETAFSLAPFLVPPIQRYDNEIQGVEGGVMGIFEFSPYEDWVMVIAQQAAAIRDVDRRQHAFEWYNYIYLGYELSDEWEVYLDFETSLTSISGDPWIGNAGFGVVYSITEDWLIETGTSYGLTRSADDFTAYVSIAYRF